MAGIEEEASHLDFGFSILDFGFPSNDPLSRQRFFLAPALNSASFDAAPPPKRHNMRAGKRSEIHAGSSARASSSEKS